MTFRLPWWERWLSKKYRNVIFLGLVWDFLSFLVGWGFFLINFFEQLIFFQGNGSISGVAFSKNSLSLLPDIPNDIPFGFSETLFQKKSMEVPLPYMYLKTGKC